MTLQLPEPHGQHAGAYVGRDGRRSVSWRVGDSAPFGEKPERLKMAGNYFTMAWFEVRETAAWSNEVRLYPSRRTNDGSGRGSFTDAAYDRLTAELLPLVHRYGFDRWWTELYQAKADKARFHRGGLGYAQRLVRYEDEKIMLNEMLSLGLLEMRPVQRDNYGRTPGTWTVTHRGRELVSVVADVVDPHGEVVGHLSEAGHLEPPRSTLDEPAQPSTST